MVIVFPIVALLVGVLAGWICLRNGWGLVALALAVALSALLFWALYMGDKTQGWDALGYAIVSLLGALPGLLGMGIGALIGWWRRLKAEARSNEA